MLLEQTVNDYQLSESATYQRIDKSRLIENEYTISLLNEAFRIKLIDRNTVNQIQLQLMNLLKDIILRYTSGNSTSVTTDTAENLLCSIIYTIDTYALNCSDPEEAVSQLRKDCIEEIYKKGITLVVEMVREARELYLKIRKDRLKAATEAYEITITEGIASFFNNYNIVFGAHIASVSIDYPLVFDNMSIKGVHYVRNYLMNLKIENDFCRLFKSSDIEELLKSFGSVIRMDHKIELINIFELVFNNAIFSAMTGSNNISLILTNSEFEINKKLLYSSICENISSSIYTAVESLTSLLDISDPGILNYINKYTPIFIKRVLNAVETNTLEKILIISQEESGGESTLSLEVGKRMDNKEFSSLVNKLTRLSNTRDKILLINTRITSLYDFIDVLSSDCLFGEEYEKLFQSLGEGELAVLAKVVFYEELRDETGELQRIAEDYLRSENQWQEYFCGFLGKADESQINTIEELIKNVDYEELKFY